MHMDFPFAEFHIVIRKHLGQLNMDWMMLSEDVPCLALIRLGIFYEGKYFIPNHEHCLGKLIHLKLI